MRQLSVAVQDFPVQNKFAISASRFAAVLYMSATFLLFLPTAMAQSTQVLSWSDCIALALKNNAELQAQNARLLATRASLGSAQSSLYPQIFAELSLNRQGGSSNASSGAGGGAGGSSTFATTQSYAGSINASENLFGGFQTVAQIEKARAEIAAGEAALRITKASISSELKNAFERLLFAKKYITLTAEITKRRSDNLRLVDLRFQSGRENRGSVFLSEAYLASAKFDDLQAADGIFVAHKQLAKVLGFDETDPTEKTFDISDTLPVKDAPKTQPDLRELVLEVPDYQQVVAQVAVAKASLREARSAFFPKLDLTGALGRTGADFFPDENHSWSIGLKLSIPLFSGGKDYYDTRSALQNEYFAEGTRMNMARLILSNLEQAYRGYIEAIEKFKVDESFRKAALVRSQIARTKYNNGLLTFEDWDLIENDLINRQKNYLNSERDRMLSEANWEQVQGKGVIP
jgi:outer membrane protein